MNEPTVDYLILDAHGVCFNNPFKPFLSTLAQMTYQRPEDVQRRWMDELRTPAWLGEIGEQELWQRLTRSIGDTECWQALLEIHYKPGPVARHLRRWGSAVPIWIMSNHRTTWLLRRFMRYDMADCFTRIYVSDEQGLVKPDIRFFERVASRLPRPGRALFIDDQQANVDSARQAGMQALCVDHPNLLIEVERMIGVSHHDDEATRVASHHKQR